MFVLDSILLLLIVVALHFLKYNNPNFLFFCRGAILFLPPDEETRPTKKKGSQEPQVELKILQVEYPHVKDYPMSDQYERVLFLLASLVFYIPLRWIASIVLNSALGPNMLTVPSSFTMIVCLVLLVYIVKLGLGIFWISSYNVKYSVAICICLNAIFYGISRSLEGSSGQDGMMAEMCLDFRKHLSIIFGRNITDSLLSYGTLMGIILGINVLLCLALIPAVIKMGNWYTKTLKEVYYEDESTAQISDEEVRKGKQQKQKQLKKRSAKTIRLINVYLVSMVLFLALSHRYFHQFISPLLADILRSLLISIIIFINAYTLKDAIEFNGSFAYKYLNQYLATDDANQRAQLRKRIVPYLYLIWYHKFQFMLRVMIPLILFLILIDSRYVHSPPVPVTPIIAETHCGVLTDELNVLQNLYKCEASLPTGQIHSIQKSFSNGIIVGASFNDDLDRTKDRVGKYGLMSTGFISEMVELLLWYCNISAYGMTLVYILFLRKTVYDI